MDWVSHRMDVLIAEGWEIRRVNEGAFAQIGLKVLMIPGDLSDPLNRNLAAHEIGHALWTSAEDQTELGRSIYGQAAEDARINLLLRGVWPAVVRGTIDEEVLEAWKSAREEAWLLAVPLVGGFGTLDAERILDIASPPVRRRLLEVLEAIAQMIDPTPVSVRQVAQWLERELIHVDTETVRGEEVERESGDHHDRVHCRGEEVLAGDEEADLENLLPGGCVLQGPLGTEEDSGHHRGTDPPDLLLAAAPGCGGSPRTAGGEAEGDR